MLSGPEYLVCYDFDETITQNHVHNFLAKGKVPAGSGLPLFEQAFAYGGLKNPELLKLSMQKALANGHKVAITSFTLYPEIIPPYLAKLGLTNAEIEQIKVIGGFPTQNFTLDTTAKIPPFMQAGKLVHIAAAKRAFNIRHNNVILVDDSESNVRIGIQNGLLGIKAPKNGETQYNNYLNELMTYVEKPALQSTLEQTRQNPTKPSM